MGSCKLGLLGLLGSLLLVVLQCAPPASAGLTDTIPNRSMGDTFQMTCTYSSNYINNPNYLLQFFKEKMRVETPGSSTEYGLTLEAGDVHSNAYIAPNGTQLNEFFARRNDSSDERYLVTWDKTGSSTYKYTLRITDLRPEDSGTLGCQVVDVSDGIEPYFKSQQWRTLYVPGPVKDITFSVDGQQITDQFDCQEGREYRLGCTVVCTNFVPEDVFIFIGPDADTPMFNFTIGNYLAFVHGSLDATPLVSTQIKAYVLGGKYFRPTYYHNGWNLYVLVKPYGDFPMLNFSTVMNVTFAPKEVSCTEQKVEVKESGEVTLVCHVRANPPADVPNWRVNGTAIDMSDRRYSIVNGVDGDVTTSTLTVTNVTSSDYGHYMLYGTNMLGDTGGVYQDESTYVTLVTDAGCMTAASLLLMFGTSVFITLTTTSI